MLAAHHDLLDDSELLKVDESERLFDSSRFIDTFDRANNFAKRREVLQTNYNNHFNNDNCTQKLDRFTNVNKNSLSFRYDRKQKKDGEMKPERGRLL